MFKDAIVLDRELHANHKLKLIEDFSHARNVLSAPLVLGEIIPASREFPIIFSTSGRFVPVAQMGYSAGQNIYIDEEGNWTARYTPAHLRRYPFVLGEKATPGDFFIMVDENVISLDADGPSLFEHGEIPKGGAIDRAREFLLNYQKELDQTEMFLKPLAEADVLTRQTFTIRKGEQELGTVTELQVVDKEKLSKLDNKTLADWVRRGLMGLIMAHLHSLDNWTSLKTFQKTETGAA